MTCGMTIASCNGDKYSYYEGDATPNADITVSKESIAFHEGADTLSFDVSTTGKEWGVYATSDFIKLDYETTSTPRGKVTVMVDANPTTEVREGSVVIMSGTARKSIPVTQQASIESNAPEISML